MPAADADLADFNESSSEKTISVVRGSTAIIDCAVPVSIPSPADVSYLHDDRPLTLTCMSAVDLIYD